MKKTILFIVLATLCLFFQVEAQDKFTISSLKIGDQVPNLSINGIINYPAQTAKISDFKNKLLILDFMNTYCGSCIEALPRLDSLQRQYAGKIQIFIVIDESIARVRAFLKNNPIAKNIKPSIIVGDKTLSRLFPHQYVSHEVWINNGTVRAITTAQYVQSKNIEEILKQGAVNWELKSDFAFDYHAPFLVTNEQHIPEQILSSGLFFSALTGHLKGVATRHTYEVDSLKRLVKIHYINFSIVDLYLATLPDQKDFSVSYVQIRAEHPGNFIFRNNNIEYRDVWNNLHTWCYEGVFPIDFSEQEIKRKIQKDLDFYLHLNSGFETVRTKVIQLVKDSTHSSLVKQPFKVRQNGKELLNLITVNDLLKKLNHDFVNRPADSNLSPDEVINVHIDAADLMKESDLNEALKAYHLTFKNVEKEVRMFVLSASNSPIQITLNHSIYEGK
ncbi:TlpA family protein disulfide reductase [Mucilaginibacter sp. SMC90]|uniref:TlpA family protein disulfide reductase n=1 Tax=Mucilaginibacter sp. SMC90 TaxID=2929803 RepID=UPI001FB27AB3|nr:TlpA disulfide reductase family protein [Mucilaginibacter sp. SMC90]UOE49170.1 TlpA family protein disulfide reductase [Mucilaginibacter sp. SMC90]